MTNILHCQICGQAVAHGEAWNEEPEIERETTVNGHLFLIETTVVDIYEALTRLTRVLSLIVSKMEGEE